MKSNIHIVVGENMAAKVAELLVVSSVWFNCEPQPDGRWQFTTKPEDGAAYALAVAVDQAGGLQGCGRCGDNDAKAEHIRACPDCGVTMLCQPSPDARNADAWRIMGKSHADDCDFIRTRDGVLE